MAQIKIYGVDYHINSIKNELSSVIHKCLVEAFKMPKDKRFHRFFSIKEEDFIYPKPRSNKYIIIEITIIKGRSKEAKKRLIYMLFQKIYEDLGIKKEDIEIIIYELNASNFGFRGFSGDNIKLDYEVKV